MEKLDRVSEMSEMSSPRQRQTLRTRKWSIALACVACLGVLLLRLFFHHAAPNLTTCTRIEIHYTGGALNHLFESTSLQQVLFSEEERAYVSSFDTWTVTDPNLIGAFADDICQGRYQGRLFGVIADTPVDIVGYRGRWRAASFRLYSSNIVTTWRRHFSYRPGALIQSLRRLGPPGIEPLEARWECAKNMYLIYGNLGSNPRSPRPDLDPNHWCDAFVERSPITYAPWFICPSVHSIDDENDPYLAHSQDDRSQHSSNNRTSDYAMNSHCTVDSPDDTVFLFESQPGWNQHGGPELFTFDNHNPKGGCVLLKGGEMRFIRTREELAQLRWQPWKSGHTGSGSSGGISVKTNPMG